MDSANSLPPSQSVPTLSDPLDTSRGCWQSAGLSRTARPGGTSARSTKYSRAKPGESSVLNSGSRRRDLSLSLGESESYEEESSAYFYPDPRISSKLPSSSMTTKLPQTNPVDRRADFGISSLLPKPVPLDRHNTVPGEAKDERPYLAQQDHHHRPAPDKEDFSKIEEEVAKILDNMAVQRYEKNLRDYQTKNVDHENGHETSRNFCQDGGESGRHISILDKSDLLKLHHGGESQPHSPMKPLSPCGNQESREEAMDDNSSETESLASNHTFILDIQGNAMLNKKSDEVCVDAYPERNGDSACESSHHTYTIDNELDRKSQIPDDVCFENGDSLSTQDRSSEGTIENNVLTQTDYDSFDKEDINYTSEDIGVHDDNMHEEADIDLHLGTSIDSDRSDKVPGNNGMLICKEKSSKAEVDLSPDEDDDEINNNADELGGTDGSSDEGRNIVRDQDSMSSDEAEEGPAHGTDTTLVNGDGLLKKSAGGESDGDEYIGKSDGGESEGDLTDESDAENPYGNSIPVTGDFTREVDEDDKVPGAVSKEDDLRVDSPMESEGHPHIENENEVSDQEKDDPRGDGAMESVEQGYSNERRVAETDDASRVEYLRAVDHFVKLLNKNESEELPDCNQDQLRHAKETDDLADHYSNEDLCNCATNALNSTPLQPHAFEEDVHKTNEYLAAVEVFVKLLDSRGDLYIEKTTHINNVKNVLPSGDEGSIPISTCAQPVIDPSSINSEESDTDELIQKSFDGETVGDGTDSDGDDFTEKCLSGESDGEKLMDKSFGGESTGDEFMEKSVGVDSDGDEFMEKSVGGESGGDNFMGNSVDGNSDGDEFMEKDVGVNSDGDEFMEKDVGVNSDGDEFMEKSVGGESDGDEFMENDVGVNSDGDEFLKKSIVEEYDGDEFMEKSVGEESDGDIHKEKYIGKESDEKELTDNSVGENISDDGRDPERTDFFKSVNHFVKLLEMRYPLMTDSADLWSDGEAAVAGGNEAQGRMIDMGSQISKDCVIKKVNPTEDGSSEGGRRDQLHDRASPQGSVQYFEAVKVFVKLLQLGDEANNITMYCDGNGHHDDTENEGEYAKEAHLEALHRKTEEDMISALKIDATHSQSMRADSDPDPAYLPPNLEHDQLSSNPNLILTELGNYSLGGSDPHTEMNCDMGGHYEGGNQRADDLQESVCDDEEIKYKLGMASGIDSEHGMDHSFLKDDPSFGEQNSSSPTSGSEGPYIESDHNEHTMNGSRMSASDWLKDDLEMHDVGIQSFSQNLLMIPEHRDITLEDSPECEESSPRHTEPENDDRSSLHRQGVFPDNLYYEVDSVEMAYLVEYGTGELIEGEDIASLSCPLSGADKDLTQQILNDPNLREVFLTDDEDEEDNHGYDNGNIQDVKMQEPLDQEPLEEEPLGKVATRVKTQASYDSDSTYSVSSSEGSLYPNLDQDDEEGVHRDIVDEYPDVHHQETSPTIYSSNEDKASSNESFKDYPEQSPIGREYRETMDRTDEVDGLPMRLTPICVQDFESSVKASTDSSTMFKPLSAVANDSTTDCQNAQADLDSGDGNMISSEERPEGDNEENKRITSISMHSEEDEHAVVETEHGTPKAETLQAPQIGFMQRLMDSAIENLDVMVHKVQNFADNRSDSSSSETSAKSAENKPVNNEQGGESEVFEDEKDSQMMSGVWRKNDMVTNEMDSLAEDHVDAGLEASLVLEDESSGDESSDEKDSPEGIPQAASTNEPQEPEKPWYRKVTSLLSRQKTEDTVEDDNQEEPKDDVKDSESSSWSIINTEQGSIGSSKGESQSTLKDEDDSSSSSSYGKSKKIRGKSLDREDSLSANDEVSNDEVNDKANSPEDPVPHAVSVDDPQAPEKPWYQSVVSFLSRKKADETMGDDLHDEIENEAKANKVLSASSVVKAEGGSVVQLNSAEASVEYKDGSESTLRDDDEDGSAAECEDDEESESSTLQGQSSIEDEQMQICDQEEHCETSTSAETDRNYEERSEDSLTSITDSLLEALEQEQKQQQQDELDLVAAGHEGNEGVPDDTVNIGSVNPDQAREKLEEFGYFEDSSDLSSGLRTIEEETEEDIDDAFARYGNGFEYGTPKNGNELRKNSGENACEYNENAFGGVDEVDERSIENDVRESSMETRDAENDCYFARPGGQQDHELGANSLGEPGMECTMAEPVGPGEGDEEQDSTCESSEELKDEEEEDEHSRDSDNHKDEDSDSDEDSRDDANNYDSGSDQGENDYQDYDDDDRNEDDNVDTDEDPDQYQHNEDNGNVDSAENPGQCFHNEDNGNVDSNEDHDQCFHNEDNGNVDSNEDPDQCFHNEDNGNVVSTEDPDQCFHNEDNGNVDNTEEPDQWFHNEDNGDVDSTEDPDQCFHNEDTGNVDSTEDPDQFFHNEDNGNVDSTGDPDQCFHNEDNGNVDSTKDPDQCFHIEDNANIDSTGDQYLDDEDNSNVNSTDDRFLDNAKDNGNIDYLKRVAFLVEQAASGLYKKEIHRNSASSCQNVTSEKYQEERKVERSTWKYKDCKVGENTTAAFGDDKEKSGDRNIDLWLKYIKARRELKAKAAETANNSLLRSQGDEAEASLSGSQAGDSVDRSVQGNLRDRNIDLWLKYIKSRRELKAKAAETANNSLLRSHGDEAEAFLSGSQAGDSVDRSVQGNLRDSEDCDDSGIGDVSESVLLSTYQESEEDGLRETRNTGNNSTQTLDDLVPEEHELSNTVPQQSVKDIYEYGVNDVLDSYGTELPENGRAVLSDGITGLSEAGTGFHVDSGGVGLSDNGAGLHGDGDGTDLKDSSAVLPDDYAETSDDGGGTQPHNGEGWPADGELIDDGARLSEDGSGLSGDGAEQSGNSAGQSGDGAGLSGDGAEQSGNGAGQSGNGAVLSGDGSRLSEDGAGLSEEGAKLSDDGAGLSADGSTLPGDDGSGLSDDGAGPPDSLDDSITEDDVVVVNPVPELLDIIETGYRGHMGETSRSGSEDSAVLPGFSTDNGLEVAGHLALACLGVDPNVVKDYNKEFSLSYGKIGSYHRRRWRRLLSKMRRDKRLLMGASGYGTYMELGYDPESPPPHSPYHTSHAPYDFNSHSSSSSDSSQSSYRDRVRSP